MPIRRISFFVCFCITIVNIYAQDSTAILTKPIPIRLTDFSLELEQRGDQTALVINSPGAQGTALLAVNGKALPQALDFRDGRAAFDYPMASKGQLLFLQHQNGSKKINKIYHLSRQGRSYRLKSLALWLSILPPLVAILLALLFREVITSLFAGIFVGAFIANGLSFSQLLHSFWNVLDRYVIQALNSRGHLSVIVFSLLIGGMVALISRNGGMAGVVKSLSKYARTARSSQFITLLLGIAIFFDDYANTLIVGNTMRSVTDKFRISREKLAYIVDSTAAPVSAIAFITTWIGAELGYIQSGIIQLDNFDTDISPYALFISSLKYSFYPILTLLFIPIIIYTRRDYGPMWKAEVRARTTGQVSPVSTQKKQALEMDDLSPVAGAPLKWQHAAFPVLTVILVTIYGLIYTGMDSLYKKLEAAGAIFPDHNWASIWEQLPLLLDTEQASFLMKTGLLIGASDSYIALLWASSAGVVVALLFTLGARIMTLFEAMETLSMGFKTMLPALIILTLAWSLAITTQELHTADFLTALLQDSISPYAMPMIIFILSALIAFSTGSSWSTMAILYPIAIPTTWAICQVNGLEMDISMELLLNVIAVVLAASVLGDHCSPISDTTILSSLASDCNHIDHVKTQMPYALTVGSVSLLAGGLSTWLGGGWGISLVLILLSLGILYLVVRRFGKTVEGLAIED